MAQIEPVEPSRDEADRSKPQCNYDACTRTYSAFRSEEGPYQPYDGGPRRLCQR
jgi:penicillin-binding protein 1A